MNKDLLNAAPEAIGTLCFDLHPEAQNKIEAVDLHIRYLYDLIQLKLKNAIAAADDIEFYFILLEVKRELMKATTLNQLQNNGYQSGGLIGFSNPD